ncbi:MULTISPECIES: RNA polymerase sigma factor [Pandoraea]|uniref:RNA polymerase subunit sigma-70 n=1 Tax=Pandoraea nosoerga TaxID=2508296 RepID=A0A5E4VYJ9_9BURK|nr:MULTISPECIES: RNA polymerase sigma factor [Pandoraea]VVE17498.1 RNA polymerase subunit sigma-70 [Pandoraea nosoerga]
MTEEVRLALMAYLSTRYLDLKRHLVRSLRSPELAEDALHDTWLRLTRLEDQATVLNPHGFLLRMATNIAINHLRSNSQQASASEIDEILEMPDASPGPEQTTGARADMAALVRAIERLPQRRRDVLLLVRWEGLSQKEVAARLGVTVSVVEHELRRAQDFCAEQMARREGPARAGGRGLAKKVGGNAP